MLGLNVGSSESTTIFFFFNDTATTEIYTLSLHDALPISLLDNQWRWFQDTQLKAATTKPSLFRSPPVITSTTAASSSSSSFSRPSATAMPPAPQPMDLDHTNLVKKDPCSSLCFNCGKPGHIAKVCRGPCTQNVWNVDAVTTLRLTPKDLQLLIESVRAVMVSSAPMMPPHEL